MVGGTPPPPTQPQHITTHKKKTWNRAIIGFHVISQEKMYITGQEIMDHVITSPKKKPEKLIYSHEIKSTKIKGFTSFIIRKKKVF
jgi:hypothetical protein